MGSPKMNKGVVATTALQIAASMLICLFSDAAGAASLPQKVGACTVTRISEVGSRLQGVADSGSAVSYENGGYQVSYELIQAVNRSRVGDSVKLCLTSVPEGCPKGDDRGRTYRATNLRTKGTWELPDAEHMCGGA